MEKLKQNNLEESTTSLGFCKVVNDNAKELGTTRVAALEREETLEDGTKVTVAGMTPDAIRNLLNEQGANVSNITPGEPAETIDNSQLDGIVQKYNKISK